MKNKKIAKLIVAISVIAAIGAGATLAYLNKVTQTATNVFTSDKNIQLELREPGWDGYQFGELNSDNLQPIGDEVKKGSEEDKTLGFNQAKEYLPGVVINKNPMVKNTGTEADKGIPVYAAIGLKYYSGVKGTDTAKEMTYDEFKAAYLETTGITFNTNWEDISDSKKLLFMYKPQLKPGESTSENPVFSTVPVKSSLTVDASGQLPKFYIEVTAYAVQSESLGATEPASIATAKAELRGLAGIKK